MAVQRNTATRDKHRRLVAKSRPPCYLCGGEIDYDAPHSDPLSFTIEHITPLIRGGSDTLDNIGSAHRKCNRDKGSQLPHRPGVTFETERVWW